MINLPQSVMKCNRQFAEKPQAGSRSETEEPEPAWERGAESSQPAAMPPGEPAQAEEEGPQVQPVLHLLVVPWREAPARAVGRLHALLLHRAPPGLVLAHPPAQGKERKPLAGGRARSWSVSGISISSCAASSACSGRTGALRLRRNSRTPSCITRSPSSAGRSSGRSTGPQTRRSSPPRAGCFGGRRGARSWRTT